MLRQGMARAEHSGASPAPAAFLTAAGVAESSLTSRPRPLSLLPSVCHRTATVSYKTHPHAQRKQPLVPPCFRRRRASAVPGTSLREEVHGLTWSERKLATRWETDLDKPAITKRLRGKTTRSVKPIAARVHVKRSITGNTRLPRAMQKLPSAGTVRETFGP